LTVEKLEETELLSCELFYSLTGDTVSESDYASAVNVLSPFKRSMNIVTLKRYLKTDILLLTDIRASPKSGQIEQSLNKMFLMKN